MRSCGGRRFRGSGELETAGVMGNVRDPQAVWDAVADNAPTCGQVYFADGAVCV
jgi:hypothetical protein